MSSQQQFQNQNYIYTYQNANYANNGQMNQNYNYQSVNVNANNYPNSNVNNNLNNQAYNAYNSNEKLNQQGSNNQSQKNKDKTELVHKTTCANCAKKFLNILVWLAFISIFVFPILNIKRLIGIIIFAILYIVYLFVEFSSETFSFVRNIKYDESMVDYMGGLFKQHPYIIFCCECYHYRHHRGRSGSSSRTRVVSRTSQKEMPYYSWKDISGLFNLDYENAKYANKPLIKLYLKPEINFADEISYYDYVLSKKEFWNNNRYYDQYMKYWEKRGIDKLIEYNLICLDKRKKPCCLNCGVYVLYTLLMLGEIYKCYVDKYCIAQHFTIRKIVSTRYNLLEENNNIKYNNMNPMLNIYSQQYNYDYNQTGSYLTNYNSIAPTQQELNAAKIYKNYIPQYSTQNVGYSSYIVNEMVNMGNIDYNSPPTDFMYSGDQALPSNMINRQQKNETEYENINNIQSQQYLQQQPFQQPVQQQQIQNNNNIQPQFNVNQQAMLIEEPKEQVQPIITSNTANANNNNNGRVKKGGKTVEFPGANNNEINGNDNKVNIANAEAELI